MATHWRFLKAVEEVAEAIGLEASIFNYMPEGIAISVSGNGVQIYVTASRREMNAYDDDVKAVVLAKSRVHAAMRVHLL